jgi:hypothetical protein
MPAPFVWATDSGSACASSASVFGSGEWLLGLVLPDGAPGGDAFLPAFLLLYLPMMVCSYMYRAGVKHTAEAAAPLCASMQQRRCKYTVLRHRRTTGA